MQGVNIARKLNEALNIGAEHPLYHIDSTFYNLLKCFPGVLFDPQGYVLFQTKEEYQRLDPDYLGLGEKKCNVRDRAAGISGIPGYIKDARIFDLLTTWGLV